MMFLLRLSSRFLKKYKNCLWRLLNFLLSSHSEKFIKNHLKCSMSFLLRMITMRRRKKWLLIIKNIVWTSIKARRERILCLNKNSEMRWDSFLSVIFFSLNYFLRYSILFADELKLNCILLFWLSYQCWYSFFCVFLDESESCFFFFM